MPKTLNSLDELARLFEQLPEAVLKGIRNAAYKIGQHARDKLMEYPGGPSYPLKWASEKQRRWYFASRLGTKSRPGPGLPYHRQSDPWSQRLQTSWAVERTPDGALTGSRATYAPWVQSSEQQTEMHQETGWKTDAQVVAEIEQSGLIIREIEAEIADALGRL